MKHFVDIRFSSLNKAFDFVENNEFVFVISNLPFKYQVLLQANEKAVYFVRCWVRSEDVQKLH